MSIETSWSSSDNTLIIDVGASFNFSAQREFRDSYVNHEHDGVTVKINLSKTAYMDSAALGLLIQLRKYIDSRNGKVILMKPKEEVVKVLKMAQFDRLFKFEY